MTLKHKKDDAEDILDDAKIAANYFCKCGKEYKHRQGLWKHKKTCVTIKTKNDDNNNETSNDKPNNKSNVINEFENEMNKTESFDKNLLFELLKQNQELQRQLIEMSLKNNSNNITNNSINTNCNNSFNLQFFLNDKCKDAMNMSEFIDSIKVQLSDLETFENDGYADGVSNIIVKGLNA